jgi:hypothetical protein
MPQTVDRRFDVVWFGGPKSSPLQPAHFQRLLKKNKGRGHYLVMPTTQHQAEIEKSGNLLAFYYAQLNKTRKEDPPTFPVVTAQQMQKRIVDAYHAENFRTGWIFLNEISSALWPSSADYRKWLLDIVTGLSNRGLKPVLFSPFPAPPKNAADWKKISEQADIAVENYLSGRDILAKKANGASWCQQQYGATMKRYGAHGIPAEKIFITEHFGHTKFVSNVNRGRTSINLDQWLEVIDMRTAALRKIGFGGFVSFAWMYNQMGAPLDALLQATDRYLAGRLP